MRIFDVVSYVLWGAMLILVMVWFVRFLLSVDEPEPRAEPCCPCPAEAPERGAAPEEDQ